MIKVWNHKGIRPSSTAYKASFVRESFTISVITTLADTTPLVLKIQEEHGDSRSFVDFVTSALPFIFPGGVVIGDNCSFHCKGEMNNPVF